MADDIIVPVPDWQYRIGTLCDASDLAAKDPAQLTDLHLRHLAAHSQADAQRARAARDAAITRQAETQRRKAAERLRHQRENEFTDVDADRLVDAFKRAIQTGDVTALNKALEPYAEAIRQGVLEAATIASLRDLNTRLGKLEAVRQHSKQIEAKPHVLYKGEWIADSAYGTGMAVTYRGQFYRAVTATCQPPGSDDSWIRIEASS